MTVTIAGGESGTVTLQMYDAVIDPQGGWRSVPYGSTSDSLNDVLSIEPSTFAYAPTGGPQTFTSALSVEAAAVTTPLLGSLRVSVQPAGGAAGGGVSQQGAVEVQVIAAPSGASIEDLPTSLARLALQGLGIEQISPWTPVDSAFPDIPWVVNHGPVAIVVSGENTGTLVLDSRVTYSVTRLSPLAWVTGADAAPVFTVENRPRYLLAGAPFVDTTTSQIPVAGSPSVDALPFIGLVRVNATATGGLVGIEAPPATISRTFLVFPWKESLFVFLVWLFQREWRHRRGRKVHTGDSPPPPTLRTRVRDRASRLFGRRRAGGGGN